MSFPHLKFFYQQVVFPFFVFLILLFSLQTYALAEQSVKVGFYENPPKIFIDANGKVSGFWPDLIKYIAEQENWQIEYVRGTWSEGLNRLQSKQIDIMPDVAYTEKRNALYAFSEFPVIMSWSRLYVHKKNSTILSIQDLDGKRIAALKGSVNLEGEDGLRQITSKFNLDCTFIEFDNYTEIFKAIEEKTVDAGITNRNFGNKNAKNFLVKKTPVIFQPINIKFAFPQNSELTPYLQNKIHEQLSALLNDDSSIYYLLLQKYFEAEIAEKKVEIFPQWLVNVLESIAAVGLILLLIIIVSRVQVRRKTTELSNEKERLEGITENVPGVVFQFYSRNDGESGVRYTSRKLFDIFDLEFIEDPPVLLQTFIENIHEEDRQSFIDSIREVAEKQIPWSWSGRYVKPSGEIIWFEGLSSPISRRDEVVFNGLLLDITSVKKLEEEKNRAEIQLYRGQKMEAIGMMAGGVAHDLNNILSGIVNYPELMLLDLPQESPLRRPLETIQSSGLRAAAVVADLLTVARGAATNKEVCILNEIVKEYLDSPELKHPLESQPEITLYTNFAPDLFTLQCSPIHIRKCLLNLFINACEAVDTIGSVTISTSNRYIDKPLKGYDEVCRGEYAVLSVADTGTGISATDIDHIFEPFYTKKVMGRSGTGLGLAVVWNAVQDHNGYIDITTDDQGTCFDLYFPASRKPADNGKEKNASQDLQGKGQTVLVVDDEAIQRDITISTLTGLGYKVSAVASGGEAVDFLKTHKIDLLVLDMIMDPDMNGRQTYEQVIARHPGQKAIITSGYSETDEVRKAQKLGAGIFIKKPYSINQLGYAIKQELEA